MTIKCTITKRQFAKFFMESSDGGKSAQRLFHTVSRASSCYRDSEAIPGKSRQDGDQQLSLFV